MQTMDAPNVKWGEWIGEGWQMFANQWQGWVLLMLVFVILIMIPVAPIYVFVIGAQLAAATNPDIPPESPGVLFFLVMAVMYLVFILGSAFLMRGVFLSAAGGVILCGILSAIGAVFCILPAFIVAGLFYFTMPLVIEKEMGVFDAMRASFDRTKGHWFMFALFAFVVSLLAQVGSVACGIGILATFPLFFTINAVAFRDLFGVSGAQSFLPQAASPSGYAQPWTTPSEPPTANIQCQRCGATGFAPGARFCNVCGANLAG